MHMIRLSVLTQVVLDNIRYHARLLRDEKGITDYLIKRNTRYRQDDMKSLTVKLNRIEKRRIAVNDSTKQLFEQHCGGNVPDSVFKNLMHDYEAEIVDLDRQYEELDEMLWELKNATTDISKWIDEFKRCTDIRELNRETLAKFVDFIEIGEARQDKEQAVNVQYNFFGKLQEPQGKKNKSAENALAL